MSHEQPPPRAADPPRAEDHRALLAARIALILVTFAAVVLVPDARAHRDHDGQQPHHARAAVPAAPTALGPR